MATSTFAVDLGVLAGLWALVVAFDGLRARGMGSPTWCGLQPWDGCAALTLVKAHAAAWGLAPKEFQDTNVHVHVPAGAVPKDGPSAGLAMFLALASVFTGRAVSHELAVTGEISLRGGVLPVGGIRDKVLAAARAGIRRLLLPVGNRADWAEVPASAQAKLTVHWVETVDEAMAQAFSSTGMPSVPAVYQTAPKGISP